MSKGVTEVQIDEAKFSRYGLLAGAAFTVVVIVSSFIAGSSPTNSDSDREIFKFLVDEQDSLKIGAYLGGIGLVLFLWFLGSLYGRMRPTEGGAGRLSRVALIGGVVGVTLATVANAIASSAALRPNPGVFRISTQFYGYTSFALAVFTAALSLLIWNNGLLPKWVGYVGEAIAIGWFVAGAVVATEKEAIATIGMIVFAVWGIWVAVVSVMLYREADTATT